MEVNKDAFIEKLNAITQELDLPLEDERIPFTYFKRHPEGVSPEIANEVFPIWMNSSKNERAIEKSRLLLPNE